MVLPDLGQTLPPSEYDFGRFGTAVGENFGLWRDYCLGVEIGGISGPVTRRPGESVVQPDRYVSMGLVMPLASSLVPVRDHNALIAFPKPNSYQVLTAEVDYELLEPSPTESLQFTDWVVSPQENPLRSFRRNSHFFPVREETIYVPTDALEMSTLIQTTVDEAMDLRSAEERFSQPVDDQMLENILGHTLFRDLSRLGERRAS